eukprot:9215243-Pyramimonas_sp.AAC.1
MVNARKFEGTPMYTVRGAMEYMSPEMVTQQGYTFLTDIWSFGILIFELLTGANLFAEAAEQVRKRGRH